jgi:hypothetical protein
MLVLIEVVAGVVVALVVCTTAITQLARWISGPGYAAGRLEAYREVERAAQARVAAEVEVLRKLLGRSMVRDND